MHTALEKLWHHFIPSKHNAYRPHILRRPWLLFFLTLALAAEGFLVANLLVRQSSEVFLAAVVPGEVIALTNVERAQHNEGTLQTNALLTQAAQAKAEDMAKKGYFAHVGPGGVEPWVWIEQAGYDYGYAGENLAVRFVDSSDVVEAWMESPSHRANLLKAAYSAVGVGVANGVYEGQPATYIVQYFASPRGTVQGASVGTSNISVRGFIEGLQRQMMRLLSDPQNATAWTLGVVGTVLALAVVLTFFVHIQIQPGAMLVSGSVLAVFAFSLIVVNAHFLETMGEASSASAIEAPLFSKTHVVTTPQAASVAR